MNGVRRLGPHAFVVIQATGAAALALPLVLRDDVPVHEPRIPLLAMLGCWVAFELVMVQLRFGPDREHGEEVVLTGVPLALGLLFAAPADLLVAGVVAGPLISLVQGRQGALKRAFNTTNRAVEVALALTLYRALDPVDPLSLQGWFTLALVITVTEVTSSLCVALVISLATGLLPTRGLARVIAVTLPLPAISASVAMVVALVLVHVPEEGPWLVAPVVVFGVVMLTVLQRLSILTERHDHLTSLNDLSERITAAAEGGTGVAQALDSAVELLVARTADAYVLSDSEARPVLHWRHDGVAGVTRVEDPSATDLIPGTLDRHTLVVAAPMTAGHELVLKVSGRVRSARPFRAEDRRVLEMITRQTAAHLHTTDLIEQLRHDALHDPFSDLPNRRALTEILEQRIELELWSEVVLIGMRDFPAVNEALGHDHGDDLIRQVGCRLRQVAGPGSAVARVGDDGFAVLLPLAEGHHGGDAEIVASLVASLGRPFTLGRVQAMVGASAGVVVDLRVDDVGANDLLRRAGIALRYAERTGQPVEHYRPQLETATPSRLALAADLQAAVTRGELRLFGQPQVRLVDGAVVGAEALLRWEHPDLGLLGPDTFLPLAVQTGLDRPVTSWVVNAAVKAAAEWRASGLDLTLSVNVSASALADRHLPDMVQEMLELRGVPGESLVVELTESDLLASPTAAARNLHRLAALGVGVSVDDFGTGYSSLSHLRRLPVDEVKIDRSFVDSMLDDLDDAAIVRSVIQLSRELGLRCVAEGVETRAVQVALQRLGCDLAQGYLIAEPMPLDEVAGWTSLNQRPAVREVPPAGVS